MYVANPTRYESTQYRRCGRSGLMLPPIALGLWQNFGENRPMDTKRAIITRAFDRGVTHMDLANNYGPPAGSAESAFGDVLTSDLRPYRDELVISTKAGYGMWPGPYGDWGSRKYLISSLDQSLTRMGLDYVDIFYHHRPDPQTPLEETIGALDAVVRQGKALYVGISSYTARQTREALTVADALGTPIVIHQPSYSMLNRWIEEPDDSGESLIEVLGATGVGAIAFSPLAQGLLTPKYLNGIPADSRASRGEFLSSNDITDDYMRKARALADIAAARGQTLPQLALTWALRLPEMTSVIIGASSVTQLDDNLDALTASALTGEELATIEAVLG